MPLENSKRMCLWGRLGGVRGRWLAAWGFFVGREEIAKEQAQLLYDFP